MNVSNIRFSNRRLLYHGHGHGSVLENPTHHDVDPTDESNDVTLSNPTHCKTLQFLRHDLFQTQLNQP